MMINEHVLGPMTADPDDFWEETFIMGVSLQTVLMSWTEPLSLSLLYDGQIAVTTNDG